MKVKDLIKMFDDMGDLVLRSMEDGEDTELWRGWRNDMPWVYLDWVIEDKCSIFADKEGLTLYIKEAVENF